jgi:hypothetical protein
MNTPASNYSAWEPVMGRLRNQIAPSALVGAADAGFSIPAPSHRHLSQP